MDIEKTRKILIGKFGEEKALKIIDALERDNEKRRLEGIAVHEHLERMINVMIPKDDLIDGHHYNGHRWRGNHVAMWDADAGLFKTINYTIGYFYIEDLKYFGDVRETNIDGFLPFEEILKKEIK